jgi:hypothetical protein
MKLLLINPRFPESFWSFKWAVDNIMPRDVRTINPPLGLATLAALSPPDWEIEIIDENIETIPLNPVADVIGICGMGVQFQRQKEPGLQEQGLHAGRKLRLLCPSIDLSPRFVAGEAEYIWKRFCTDYDNGSPQSSQGMRRGLARGSPCFDLLQLDKYQAVSLQFSRGCPYRCEFCDIIVMFGRKPRVKAFDQVGRELDELRKLGVTNVFFVDDNLIGNKPVAKKLMAYLRDYQKEHGYQFLFGTEASLNIAQDDELLDLFRQAISDGYSQAEPRTGSLKETLGSKHQGDMLHKARTRTE